MDAVVLVANFNFLDWTFTALRIFFSYSAQLLILKYNVPQIV